MECLQAGDEQVTLLLKRFGGDALTEWRIFQRYQNDHMASLPMGRVVEKPCTDKDLSRAFPVMSFLAGCFRVLPPLPTAKEIFRR